MKCSRPPQSGWGTGQPIIDFPCCSAFYFFIFYNAPSSSSVPCPSHLISLSPPPFPLDSIGIYADRATSAFIPSERLCRKHRLHFLYFTSVYHGPAATFVTTHQPLDPYAPQPCSVLPLPHPPPLRHPIFFFFTHWNPRRSTYSSTTQIHAHTIHVHTQHIRDGVSFPLRSRF